MAARLSDYAPGDGIAGRVFQSGQMMAVEDAAFAPAPANEISAAEGIRSVLSVPIRISGQIFGVFGMDYCQPRSFSPEDTRLCMALAQRAAIAIENARLYEQAEQAATLEERQRLARELHDAVTQSLYSLVLLSEAGRRHARGGNLEQVEHHLGRLGETAQQALKEMRLLVYELRPLALREVGLAGALQQRLEAVEKRAGIQARLFVVGQADLPPPLDEELYRIAQEALNNALKHAFASAVTVHLRASLEAVELEIGDNGRGFAPLHGDTAGIGLHSMRERAERLGAALDIQSTPDEGTRILVRVPLAADDRPRKNGA
jgi:signal transduction histidine kinase